MISLNLFHCLFFIKKTVACFSITIQSAPNDNFHIKKHGYWRSSAPILFILTDPG